MCRPEKLFDHLLRKKELLTYREAHECLVGPIRNGNHAITSRAAVRVALSTRPRFVEGASIRLDALLVAKVTGEPGPEHWQVRLGIPPPISLPQGWRRLFGGWKVCECRCPH